MNEVEKLLESPVFQHFHQVCRIPHPSGGEKRLSDFILAWAKGLGLEAMQDAVANIFIRKPASPGCEGAPGVLLQAHLDMVCEKAAESGHDFQKDPIPWAVEGGFLTTGGRTTLGADDGIGVAMAMAALEEDCPGRPALEALFTVSEESDFTGASHFDAAQIRSKFLINLDHTRRGEILCGSCGGTAVEAIIPLPGGPIPAGWEAYRLTVTGLKGGHSGEDIHRGRGSANSLLGRVLLAAEKAFPYYLLEIKGGSFRLAIPREASATLCLAPENAAKLKALLPGLEAGMRAELAETGDALSLSLAPGEPAERGALPGPVVTALILAPDGIFQMNEQLTGLVDTSVNLGEVYGSPRELRMVFEIRSAQKSLQDYILAKVERLCGLLGGRCEASKAYPSWAFRPGSQLRRLAVEAYKARFGEEPACLTVHAGLEVGYLYEKNPGLDAIAMGPDCFNFHSPSEALSIASVGESYGLLLDILEGVCNRFPG